MWFYDKQTGAIAVSYAQLRVKEAAQADRNVGGIKDCFLNNLACASFDHRQICLEHVGAFSAQLAYRAFDDLHFKTRPADLEPLLYEKMCYIFTLYQTRHEGLLLGFDGETQMNVYAQRMNISKEAVLHFFHTLTKDLWELTLQKKEDERLNEVA